MLRTRMKYYPQSSYGSAMNIQPFYNHSGSTVRMAGTATATRDLPA
jgi:hypothetical protein